MMKKRLLAVLCGVTLMAGVLAGCAGKGGDSGTTKNGASSETLEGGKDSAEAGGGIKIGITVQSLSNQVWAETCTKMEELAKADGNELTYMSCDDTSSKQIEQIENFISSKCDVIMVNPSDPDAIEAACAQAREAGIKVMCWDNDMENTDLNWVIDNEALGYMIGEQAAAFINDKFENGACEVAVLNYPQTQILLERENGILAALKELAPNAVVVAQQPAIDANGGLTAMETILQAHPDVKVVCCIGGGGAVGANEAFKAKAGGTIPDDIGVFAADATNEELNAITKGEANRMSVIITGVPTVLADTVYGMLVTVVSEDGYTEADLAVGETMDGKNVYRNIIPVTVDNVSEYYTAK